MWAKAIDGGPARPVDSGHGGGGRRWHGAGGVVLAARTPCAGGLVLPLAGAPALESAAQQPLAFTIEHPANRLATGGAAVTRLAAARLWGRFIAPWPVAQGVRQKNFCCVTTRRRNFGRLWWLRRRGGTLTARTLGLGVLGFDGIVLAPLGLPLGRLPAPDQPQAFGVLAVTLVPTPRLVLAPTALAQADPRPRSSRPDTLAAIWTYHDGGPRERCSPKGQPGENALTFSSGAYQNPTRWTLPIYTSEHN